MLTGTGDNARHDIDSSVPRTPSEINDLNRMMVRRMRETFGEDVVVVPSLGNNDIYRESAVSTQGVWVDVQSADVELWYAG
jgi:hypothetical protein